MKRLWLVSYDIACDRRRRRVARLLEGYGQRLHESAFVAQLRPAQLARLRRALPRCLDAQADRLTIYPLCSRDQPDTLHLGTSSEPDVAASVVV